MNRDAETSEAILLLKQRVEALEKLMLHIQEAMGISMVISGHTDWPYMIDAINKAINEPNT